ncbi:response regulator [Chitinimonas sp. PSY-7]|uniref:response regulator n=1 Tax=Chitinimonas sp. PSY-7 TaxID=3459088 RepID=UPI00403FE979
MTAAPRTANIFIVDDSRVIQAVLTEMLAELPGVSIVGMAETAEDAIAGIQRTLPDCVFLDLHLRSGTGLSVLQTIHAQLPDIVFIVMTNNEGEAYRGACMAAGASHFLTKTTELEKLKYVIGALDLK